MTGKTKALKKIYIQLMPPTPSFITLMFVPSRAIHPGSGDLVISMTVQVYTIERFDTSQESINMPARLLLMVIQCGCSVRSGWKASVINLCWNHQTIEEHEKCLVGTFQVEVYRRQKNIISFVRVHIQRADLPQTEMTCHQFKTESGCERSVVHNPPKSLYSLCAQSHPSSKHCNQIKEYVNVNTEGCDLSRYSSRPTRGKRL